jgi:hypothetical protein
LKAWLVASQCSFATDRGPRESVINGATGWLFNGDEKLVDLAIKIWRTGYPSWTRPNCRERTFEFDVKVITSKWSDELKRLGDEYVHGCYMSESNHSYNHAKRWRRSYDIRLPFKVCLQPSYREGPWLKRITHPPSARSNTLG